MIIKSRCNVQECRNHVPKDNVMCSVCFDKYLDNHYYIIVCFKCKSIVKFEKSSQEIPENKRVIETTCAYCTPSFDVKKPPDKPFDEDEQDDEDDNYLV